MNPTFVVPGWAWIAFFVTVVGLLSIDLFAHRHHKVDSKRGALYWSIAWIAAALLFNLGVGLLFGADAAEEFFSAYLLEKSLSVDNLFVFLLVFTRLRIPPKDERRVLTWGILGAIVTRGIFIALGAALLERWHSVTYLLGAILILSGVKMLKKSDPDKEGKLLPWLERHLPYTPRQESGDFTVREEGRLKATPLLVALIAIELTDVVFAVDSIPAAFAVSEHPFIVYSSNLFAILGLRSLYVVLARAVADLRYLHFGLAAVLVFAGAKMLAAPWVHLPPLVSMAIIAGCIAIAVVASLDEKRRHRRDARPPERATP